MTVVIKSGDGGNVARVTKDHQLLTNARTSVSEEHQAFQHAKAFIIHAECHLSAGSSGGLLAFTCNEEKQRVFFTRFYFDAHLLSQDIIITQIRKPTISNGTDISSTGIINKTFSSGQPLKGIVTISDSSSDLTYTGGQQYHSFNIKSGQSVFRDMKGTNVLSNNDIILFGWKTNSGNAVDGEIISLSLNLYIEENGN